MADVLVELELLTARVGVLERHTGIAPAVTHPPVPQPSSSVPPSSVPMPSAPPLDRQASGSAPPAPFAAAKSTASSTSPSFNGESFLKWAGVGLVFLAMTFLVSTAIQRGWIGPELQLLGAVLVGLALVAFAVRIDAERRGWSLALGAGGISVLAMSALFGHHELDLYSSTTTTVALVVVAGVAGWLAIRIGRASVAALAVVLLVLTPTLTSIADEHAIWVWSLWYASLTIAALTLSRIRRWLSLRLVTVALTAPPVFVVARAAQDQANRLDLPVTWVAVVATLAAYWVTTTFAANEAKDQPQTTFATWNLTGDANSLLRGLADRLALALPVAAWIITGQLFTTESTNGTWWWACTVAAIAAALAVAGYSTGRLKGVAFAAHLIGASILLSIGLAGLVDGSTLLVAIVGQALGVGWFAQRTGDQLAAVNAFVLGLIGAALTAVGLFEATEQGASLVDHLVHLAVILVAAAAAAIGRPADWSPAVAFVAWIGGLAWIVSVLTQFAQGQVAVSILWALMGAGALIVGLRRRLPSIANVGLGTLVVTVVKLLTIDLDAVDTMWRAGLFFVIGLGLLRLGLLIADLDEDQETVTPDADGPQELMAPQTVGQ